MAGLDGLDILFVTTAFLFQVALIIHFALRRWRFTFAIRWGWVIYALSLPAALVSGVLLAGGKSWSYWLSGFLALAWAAYGTYVDYVQKIQWRSPIRPSIAIPYVFLYLTPIMFYWFPLALLWKPLWYIYAVLFVISTVLNVTSHRASQQGARL